MAMDFKSSCIVGSKQIHAIPVLDIHECLTYFPEKMNIIPPSLVSHFPSNGVCLRQKKLAAVDALIEAKKNNLPLGDVYNAHEEALDQGVLGEIYSALRDAEKNKIEVKSSNSKKLSI